METPNRQKIIGGIIGAILGFLCLPVLTFLTVIIPIPFLMDLVLSLGFAPVGFLALLCLVGVFLGVIGAAIGTGIAELEIGE